MYSKKKLLQNYDIINFIYLSYFPIDQFLTCVSFHPHEVMQQENLDATKLLIEVLKIY